MKELMLNQLITGLLGLSKFELLDNLVESLYNLSRNHSCFVSGLPRLPFPVFRVPHRQSFLSLKIILIIPRLWTVHTNCIIRLTATLTKAYYNATSNLRHNHWICKGNLLEDHVLGKSSARSFIVNRLLHSLAESPKFVL